MWDAAKESDWKKSRKNWSNHPEEDTAGGRYSLASSSSSHSWQNCGIQSLDTTLEQLACTEDKSSASELKSRAKRDLAFSCKDSNQCSSQRKKRRVSVTDGEIDFVSMDQVGTSNTEDTEAGSTVDSARMMDTDATGSEKQLQMLLDSINKKESVLIAKVDNLSVKLDEKKNKYRNGLRWRTKLKLRSRSSKQN